MDDNLLTVPQVAGLLGVAQSAVRNAIYEGRLVAVEAYGKRLIRPEAVEAYRARTQADGVKKAGRPRKVVRRRGR